MKKILIKIFGLERAFSRKMHEEQKHKIAAIEASEDFSDRYKTFNVPGAGKIAISKMAGYSTGSAYGFSFSVSWGRYPYCGGVLGMKEAVRMANLILDKVAESTTTEDEQLELQNKKYKELGLI